MDEQQKIKYLLGLITTLVERIDELESAVMRIRDDTLLRRLVEASLDELRNVPFPDGHMGTLVSDADGFTIVNTSDAIEYTDEDWCIEHELMD